VTASLYIFYFFKKIFKISILKKLKKGLHGAWAPNRFSGEQCPFFPPRVEGWGVEAPRASRRCKLHLLNKNKNNKTNI
jgi:hypothetical protein